MISRSIYFGVALAAAIFSSCNEVKAFVIKTSRHATTKQKLTNLRCAADGDWSPVKVVENKPACKGMRSIAIDAGELIKSYGVPGQYVQLKVGEEKPAFLAIASPPRPAPTFEFLVKETPNNGWLTKASSGDSLDMSAVMGKGFAIEENFKGYKYDFPCFNVLMFACGSGISPIRAAIESKQLTGGFDLGASKMKLFYGAKNVETLAYKELFPEWTKLGVEVIPCFSESSAGYTGKCYEGYVQKGLQEEGIETPRNSGVLLCGMNDMVTDMKDIFNAAGTFEGRVLTNF